MKERRGRGQWMDPCWRSKTEASAKLLQKRIWTTLRDRQRKDGIIEEERGWNETKRNNTEKAGDVENGGKETPHLQSKRIICIYLQHRVRRPARASRATRVGLCSLCRGGTCTSSGAIHVVYHSLVRTCRVRVVVKAGQTEADKLGKRVRTEISICQPKDMDEYEPNLSCLSPRRLRNTWWCASLGDCARGIWVRLESVSWEIWETRRTKRIPLYLYFILERWIKNKLECVPAAGIRKLSCQWHSVGMWFPQ